MVCHPLSCKTVTHISIRISILSYIESSLHYVLTLSKKRRTNQRLEQLQADQSEAEAVTR